LAEVLKHLQEKTGVPINLDPAVLENMGVDPNSPPGGAAAQVKVKATNEKARQVLRKLLNVYELSYVILEDAVLVTWDDAATARQYLQRVNVAVENVPFKKAVRDLAKKHGINLLIDPKMLKQADAAVSLELDNTSLETAIRMLAELADLKPARMGNVMFITSDERAKKIREEEQHQFDNPLNPTASAASMRGMMMGGAAAPIRMQQGIIGVAPAPPPAAAAPLPVIPPAGLPPPLPPQPFGK
jgi:hypothetical protein